MRLPLRAHGNNREANSTLSHSRVQAPPNWCGNNLTSAAKASGDPSTSTRLGAQRGLSLIVVRPNPHSAACTGSTSSAGLGSHGLPGDDPEAVRKGSHPALGAAWHGGRH